MNNPIVAEPPPFVAENSAGEFDGLPTPPLDPAFFAADQCESAAADGGDFPMEFTLDDFDFDFPFDDSFLLDSSNADSVLNPNYLSEFSGSDPGQLGPSSGIGNFNDPRGNFKTFEELGDFGVADTSSREMGGSGVSNATSASSGNVAGHLNVPSPESNESKVVLNCHSPESQGSGNCGSNESEGLNCESGSIKSFKFGGDSMKSGVVEEKMGVEGKCVSLLLKRKKGSSEDLDNLKKQQKCSNVSNVELSDNNVGDEVDEKRRARLMRNRESAQLSRQRKKHYVEELEDRVRTMHSTIQDLNAKVSYMMAENAMLRTQLGGAGGGGVVPPPAGMYPPMMYPWMPYAPPYMVKPQGSQVPLVPIPKLKRQVESKGGKKVEKKRGEVKTKKVASISLLGLLFFMVLFGGLVPMVNVRYGGMREPVMNRDGFYEKHRGRVLAVDGPVNGTGTGYSSHCSRRGQGDGHKPNMGNGSDAIAASLYVPRNDKLVKIDGNLIIHSVLASEKAMASHGNDVKKDRETGLAIPGDLAPAIPGRHPHLYRGQRALGTGEEENGKSTMQQQWFLEGVTGPLLSSGMCTEVFQFDVSSAAPGAIIPATAARNLTVEESQNATRLSKVRNRRILNSPSVSLSKPSHNISEEQSGRTGKQENFSGNKSTSSMVVSVLVDPREAGDGDGDSMMGPKSLCRIFVVVLLDSVKYVTYSCRLPFKGSAPLVTT